MSNRSLRKFRWLVSNRQNLSDLFGGKGRWRTAAGGAAEYVFDQANERGEGSAKGLL